jgi:hypothetical protein
MDLGPTSDCGDYRSQENQMTKVEIKGKQLIITMDMEAEPQLSKSQKNLVLASTHGNEKTTAEYKGETNHNRSQRLRQGLM